MRARSSSRISSTTGRNDLPRGPAGAVDAAAGGVQRRAAELIGMPLRTFVMKLKQYGISSRTKAG